MHALSEPLMVEGFPVTIGVSIGVAQAPDDGQTPTDLLRAADVAMYKAKRTGASGRVLRSRVSKGLNVVGSTCSSDLGEALENHELYIHFQPQLRITDGEVDTVEALIRWQHPRARIDPTRRVHRPGRTDRPDRPDHRDWCCGIATRRACVNSGVTARLAVNVSPRNLQDPEFADQVFAILPGVRIPGRPARARGDRAVDRQQRRALPLHHRAAATTRRPHRDRRLRGRLLVVPGAARPRRSTGSRSTATSSRASSTSPATA